MDRGKQVDKMTELFFFSSFFDKQKDYSHFLSPVTYQTQTRIIEQGVTAEAVYLIERGLVKLTRSTPNGHEVIAGIRRGSWLIGASAVLLGGRYMYSASTVVPSTFRCIPASLFLQMVRTNHQFSLETNRLLSYEVLHHMRNFEAMSCLSARDRLMCLLQELILEQGQSEFDKSGEFTVPLKSLELAEVIAVTPEHLCRLLKEIEHEGVVRRDKGMLVVTVSAILQNKMCPLDMKNTAA